MFLCCIFSVLPLLYFIILLLSLVIQYFQAIASLCLVKQQIGERDLFEYYANIGQISDSEEHFLEDKKIKLFTVILAIMCLDSSGNTDMSSERDSSLYSKAARMSPVYLYCENATNLHISSIFQIPVQAQRSTSFHIYSAKHPDVVFNQLNSNPSQRPSCYHSNLCISHMICKKNLQSGRPCEIVSRKQFHQDRVLLVSWATTQEQQVLTFEYIVRISIFLKMISLILILDRKSCCGPSTTSKVMYKVMSLNYSRSENRNGFKPPLKIQVLATNLLAQLQSAFILW